MAAGKHFFFNAREKWAIVKTIALCAVGLGSIPVSKPFSIK